MSNGSLELMWQQAENWRLITAAICGIIVGIIYFYSLRWTVNKMSETSHKFRLFGLTALCRIALFFGVLVLIGHRNVAVILLYIGTFFLTKVAIIWKEKGKFIIEKSDNENISQTEEKAKNEL
ncbi:MAG: ATP synthase subunit I [Alphaproteobacteria bacterium]|nr:ATP synthase subunit I [Alphaproteobacteria bacterium]